METPKAIDTIPNRVELLSLLSVQENQLIVLLICQTSILLYSYILPLHVVHLSLFSLLVTMIAIDRSLQEACSTS